MIGGVGSDDIHELAAIVVGLADIGSLRIVASDNSVIGGGGEEVAFYDEESFPVIVAGALAAAPFTGCCDARTDPREAGLSRRFH
jgi:hypothetical protein